jgi:hypothetical protein
MQLESNACQRHPKYCIIRCPLRVIVMVNNIPCPKALSAEAAENTGWHWVIGQRREDLAHLFKECTVIEEVASMQNQPHYHRHRTQL